LKSVLKGRAYCAKSVEVISDERSRWRHD